MADNVWNARDVCDHLDGNDVSGCMHARVCARRSPQVHLRSATGRSHDAPCRLVMGTRRTLTGSSALSCDTAPAFTMASNSTPSIVRTFGCLQHNHRQHSHSHYVHGVSSSTRAGGRAERENTHICIPEHPVPQNPMSRAHCLFGSRGALSAFSPSESSFTVSSFLRVPLPLLLPTFFVSFSLFLRDFAKPADSRLVANLFFRPSGCASAASVDSASSMLSD